MRFYKPRPQHSLHLTTPRCNYQNQCRRHLWDAPSTPHIPSPSHPLSPSHAYPHAPHRRASPHAATYTRASRYRQTSPSARSTTHPPTPTPHTHLPTTRPHPHPNGRPTPLSPHPGRHPSDQCRCPLQPRPPHISTQTGPNDAGHNRSRLHPCKHHTHHSHTSPGHFGSATARPSTTPYTPGRNGSATARPHHHYHLW